MRTYVVLNAESPEDLFFVVKVTNATELPWTIAKRVATEDEYFREHVDDIVINGGLYARFVKDEAGDLFVGGGLSVRDDNPNNPFGIQVRPDIVSRYDGDYDQIEQYIEQQVRANVRAFFGDRQHYADLYLSAIEDEDVSFPDELYAYVHIRLSELDEPFHQLFVRDITDDL